MALQVVMRMRACVRLRCATSRQWNSVKNESHSRRIDAILCADAFFQTRPLLLDRNRSRSSSPALHWIDREILTLKGSDYAPQFDPFRVRRRSVDNSVGVAQRSPTAINLNPFGIVRTENQTDKRITLKSSRGSSRPTNSIVNCPRPVFLGPFRLLGQFNNLQNKQV